MRTVQCAFNKPDLRGATEQWRGILLSPVASASLPPHVASPPDDSLRSTLGGHGWSDIEVEDGVSLRLVVSLVVVDDISNFLLLAIDLS